MLSVQDLIAAGRVTHQSIYVDDPDGGTTGSRSGRTSAVRILIDGNGLGEDAGVYICADGTWASYGPSGLSMGHDSQELADAVQIARWIAQHENPHAECGGRGFQGDEACWGCHATGVSPATVTCYPPVASDWFDVERAQSLFADMPIMRVYAVLGWVRGRGPDRIMIDTGIPLAAINGLLADLESLGWAQRVDTGWVRTTATPIAVGEVGVGDEILVDGRPEVVLDLHEAVGQGGPGSEFLVELANFVLPFTRRDQVTLIRRCEPAR